MLKIEVPRILVTLITAITEFITPSIMARSEGGRAGGGGPRINSRTYALAILIEKEGGSRKRPLNKGSFTKSKSRTNRSIKVRERNTRSSVLSAD